MISYSFNGTTLPALPKAEGYSHAIITTITDYAYDYVLMYETKPYRSSESKIVFEIDSQWLVYVCNANSTAWVAGDLTLGNEVEGATYSYIDTRCTFMWCNEDITDLTSGEVVYTGTDPVETVYADTPVLSTNFPSSGQVTYTKDKVADALTVSATIRDEGVLSYQWYCGEETIADATTESYMPSTSEVGSKSYSCQVTNTLDIEAEYSYNGIKLPDINTIWTDKETYPYVTILQQSASAFGGKETDYVVTVNLTSTQYNFNGEKLTTSGVSSSRVLYRSYLYTNSQEVVDYCISSGHTTVQLKEFYLIDEDDKALTITSYLDNVDKLWSSYDVIDTSNSNTTVYLAASEPVPTYSYNGVILPVLPSWDRTTYPYTELIEFNGTKILLASNAPFMYDSSNSILVASVDLTTIGFVYDETANTWPATSITETFDANSGMACELLWSSYDVMNYSDNSAVYLAASNLDEAGYSYNGVFLPALPEYDTTAYPYAYLTANTSENTYMFLASNQCPYATIEGDNTLVYMGTGSATYCLFAWIDTEWQTLASDYIEDEPSSISIPTITWTNTDIPYAGGSVYLAASDPVYIEGATYTASATTDSVTVVVNEAKKGIHEKSLFYGWLAGQRVAHSRCLRLDFLDNTFPISVKHSDIWNNSAKVRAEVGDNFATFIKISNLALSCYTMSSLMLTVNWSDGNESETYSDGLIMAEADEETNYFAGYFLNTVMYYVLSIPSAGTYLDVEFKESGIYIGILDDFIPPDGYEISYTLELPPIFTIISGEGSNIVSGSYIVPYIPEYDKEAYPYAIITTTSWNGYMGIDHSYTFMATSTPRYKCVDDFDCLTIIEDQTGISCSIYYDTTGAPLGGWSEPKSFSADYTGDLYNTFSEIIWSNYDIYQLVKSEDGIELDMGGDVVSISDTIAFAKSPDSVDIGNTMIVRWNQNVTDFTSYDLVTDSSGTFYKADNEVLDKVNFIDGFYITGANVAVKITDEMVVLSDGIIGIDGVVICATKAGAVYGNKTFQEAGLYMASKDVIKMFAYVKTYPICWDVSDVTEDSVYGEGLLGNFIKISDMTPTHAQLVGGKVIMHISDGTNVTDLEAVLDLSGSMSNDECAAAQCYAFEVNEETQEPTYAYWIMMVSCTTPNTTINYSYQTVTLPEAGLYYCIYDMNESPAENLQISCEFDKGSGKIWSGDIVVNSDSITADSVTHVILNDFDITMLKVSDAIMSADDIRASSVLFKDSDGAYDLLDTIGDRVGTEPGSLVPGTSNEYFGWVNELDGCNSYRAANGGFTKLISVYDAEAAGTYFAYGHSKYDKPFPETGTYVAVLEDFNGETSEWILRKAK